MKTTICAEELRELGACEDGYNTFYEAHGESVVKLSEALDSNGVHDVFWLITKLKLSEQQENDLHLLACTYAEAVLPIYEEVYPDDSRPRGAIEAKRKWVAGEIEDDELDKAGAEARGASSAAAKEAFRTADMSARAAAGAAASEASWAAAMEAAWAARAAGRAAWAAIEARRVACATYSATMRASQKEQEKQLKQMLLSWESAQ